MKCAGPTSHNSSVLSVFLSIAIVNQAGTSGETKEASQTGRLPTRLLPSRKACAGAVPQVGVGTVSGSVVDSCQVLPGSRSQRRVPITTASEAPAIWYAIRLGAIH